MADDDDELRLCPDCKGRGYHGCRCWPAHFIKSAGGNSVLFSYPDSDQPLLTHELDVTFLNARATI